MIFFIEIAATVGHDATCPSKIGINWEDAAQALDFR